MEPITCPNCKTIYETETTTCEKCGYPFNASEKEKSIFISEQIMKKSTVSDAKDSIKTARKILWIIAAVNFIVPFALYLQNYYFTLYLIIGIVTGLLFIGFGFLTYKEPLAAIIIPLSLLLISYIIQGIINMEMLFQGFVVKAFYLVGLVYGLIGIIQAEKTKKESAYLSEQNYK